MINYPIQEHLTYNKNLYRKLERKTKNKKFELFSCFKNNENWPLRGLYFLSKDLFDEAFLDVALPESKELAEIRNRVEHRYLTLQKNTVV